jgi:hypothetical protein
MPPPVQRFLGGNAQGLAARTVHIKIYPTPQAFSERREVLRVLERFGEVTMFRSLKYYPRDPVSNAFLALFTSESVAKSAINASPVRYRLISSSPQSPSSYSPSTDSSPAQLETESASFSPMQPGTAPEEITLDSMPYEEEEKMFQINISSTTFDHSKFLASPISNPLSGPYKPIAPHNSMIAASLQRNIPAALWTPGLRDWDTDRAIWRNDEKFDESDEVEGKKRKSRHFTAERIKKRELPRVMMGLKGLREERLAELKPARVEAEN